MDVTLSEAVIFMVEERSQLTLRTDQSREIRQLGSWGARVGDFYGRGATRRAPEFAGRCWTVKKG